MQVAYIGNFEPPHSTENHVARALENNGHKVTRLQENSRRLWDHIGEDAVAWKSDVDFVLWTRTGWDYTACGYGSQYEAMALQHRFVTRMIKMGVPTVAYHLDLFWGLNPARVAILDEPFFFCDLVCTADGGHQPEFEAKGINHVWFPPGVSRAECEPGMFRDEFHSPIAFVGNWAGEYHPESKHRFELVQWLQQNYARDCAFWPQRGQNAVRGNNLRDLYASVNVVVGDSCFAGQIPNYWSDRIPETLGRGGFLVHPDVPGLAEQFPGSLPMLWPAGDWEALRDQINHALAIGPGVRREEATAARQHVLATATYEVRMDQLVKTMQDLDLLTAPPKPKTTKKVK